MIYLESRVLPAVREVHTHAYLEKLRAACDFSAAQPTRQCNGLISDMHAAIGHVNLYNVYGDCISGRAAAHNASAGHTTQKVPFDRERDLGLAPGALGPDACIDSIAGSAYFNQPSVLAAAHVKKQPIPWSTCGNQIQYTSTRKNLPRDARRGSNRCHGAHMVLPVE